MATKQTVPGSLRANDIDTECSHIGLVALKPILEKLSDLEFTWIHFDATAKKNHYYFVQKNTKIKCKQIIKKVKQMKMNTTQIGET